MNTEAALRTFDDFEPGAPLGETRLVVDDKMKQAWSRLGQPMPGDTLPHGMLVALLMRGYSEVVDRRPPGNVHGGLDMEFLDDRLENDELRVTVRCAEKELRKGRRWVKFDAEQWSGERCLTRARLTLLWAR